MNDPLRSNIMSIDRTLLWRYFAKMTTSNFCNYVCHLFFKIYKNTCGQKYAWLAFTYYCIVQQSVFRAATLISNVFWHFQYKMYKCFLKKIKTFPETIQKFQNFSEFEKKKSDNIFGKITVFMLYLPFHIIFCEIVSTA